MVGVDDAVMLDGTVTCVCASATVDTLEVVVHDGTVVSVRAASISIVGVDDAVVLLGTIVSVSPIAVAGVLDVVVGLIKHNV